MLHLACYPLIKHLAEVRKGHTVTITDHGRAVARIVPVDGPSTLERLVAEGVVRPPQRHRRGTPHPVPADGSVSDLVAEQRR
ncbi:MAG TPA: type II toxin-antitoxin system prevent-host-death family antitoxin [Mycobacteriales bacterium]|jgi:antitoxin (DNA-binding transcriptional repressor) of toxin-antitoxin stability system|nr:type II toxin-antitoxin system prevent-host-death family antitoxin [Mycobacteriales bacterium]